MPHWLEPTCFIDLSARADMGFPRSESSFVAVLGLHSTPGYFRVRVSRVHPSSSFYGQESVARPSFASPILVRLLNPREPVSTYDASNIPFLRSHDSQLAGVTASDLRFTHIPARFPD
jgi:hypothetical protein